MDDDLPGYRPVTAVDLEAAFELLDHWRHFPDYSLRGADIFFALYLPGILEHALAVSVNRTVIPGFPIKQEESWESNKVDFFLLSEDRSTVFLVALWTDAATGWAGQDEALMLAERRGLGEMLSHVAGLAERTEHKERYVYLLRALEDLDLLSVPSDVEDIVSSLMRRGLDERLREVEVLQTEASIEVVRVQPTVYWEEPGLISFETVAEYLETLEEPMAQVFAEYVRRWTKPAVMDRYSKRPAPRDVGAWRKSYFISARSTWDDDVNAAAYDFHERFGVFPNVLLANTATYRRIGMLIDKENIRGPDGERPEEGEFCELGSFLGAAYKLECAYDEELVDWAVSLVYSSDSRDGAVWAPDDDT